MGSRGGHRHSATQGMKKKSIVGDKKIQDDEFMASAIGDTEWLKQSLKNKKGEITQDKNMAFVAAERGDITWLKATMRDNDGKVTYNDQGLAPIHLAAIHGRLECLQFLIEKAKVDINLPSSTGWRPIHLCISNQTGKRAFQCLVYLLEKGADPSVCNDDKITPVHQAASEGHVQCLKALIEVGAVIHSTDIRGHMPIDMAKLWGHRKCARILAVENWRQNDPFSCSILAAENWHQSKTFLAKEMKQLEKITLKQALSDMSNEEERKAEQEFYGDQAFHSWLQNRGLPHSPTGPRHGKSPKIRAAPKTDTTQRANSIQLKGRPSLAPPAPPKIAVEKEKEKEERKEEKRETQTPRKVQEAGKEHLSGREPTPYSSTSSFGLYEKAQQSPSPAEIRTPSPIPLGGFYPGSMWNSSTRIPEKEYTTNLTDFYPRDEYTLQPRPPPVKKESGGSVGLRRLEESNVRMPELPSEVIRRKLEPEKYDRPVVFKCKHIDDVHRKHHPDREVLPRNEAALHLTNDPKSILFRDGLLFRPTATTASGSSSKSSINKGSPAPADIEGVARLVDRIARNHDHYPNIKGKEYDLNFGQVAGL